jgi:hypothetical protein
VLHALILRFQREMHFADGLPLTLCWSYLARGAPHLREVGLVSATARAALALRHAMSTSLTGLDLRNMEPVRCWVGDAPAPGAACGR